MKTISQRGRALRRGGYLFFVSLLCLNFATAPAYAVSVTDLQKQKALLEQQAAAAKAQADANAALALQAANTVQHLSAQVNQLKDSINSTQGTIADTEASIATEDQQLAALESQIGVVQRQENAMIRALYMLETSQDGLEYFSNQSVSEQGRIKEQTQSLETYLGTVSKQLVAVKAVAESDRNALVEKDQYLSTLKSQQEDQRSTLADAKSTQQAVQSNATAAQAKLLQQATAAKAQADVIAQKIDLLSATNNWGGDLVSQNDPSWYYSQIGDYTQLGYSGATINNVGCLITSIAMVTTFYGHRFTPDDMARNATFNSWGGYYWGTPSNLGVRLQPSGRVNWSVVQSQLDQGHPVIVGIYMAKIGVVNRDGSSHYIVIKAHVGDKWIIQDPIGPISRVRSYALKDVISMILTSPQ